MEDDVCLFVTNIVLDYIIRIADRILLISILFNHGEIFACEEEARAKNSPIIQIFSSFV